MRSHFISSRAFRQLTGRRRWPTHWHDSQSSAEGSATNRRRRDGAMIRSQKNRLTKKPITAMVAMAKTSRRTGRFSSYPLSNAPAIALTDANAAVSAISASPLIHETDSSTIMAPATSHPWNWPRFLLPVYCHFALQILLTQYQVPKASNVSANCHRGEPQVTPMVR